VRRLLARFATAVVRGPIVYCAEWPDVERGRVLDLLIDPKVPLKSSVDARLDGGVTLVHAQATSITNPSASAKAVIVIPYYLWANRGAGEMTVWLDVLRQCTEAGVAADLCTNLDVSGMRGWFLPSRDELALAYRNLKASGIGDFRDAGLADNFTYWTSSQQSADMANHIDFADGGRQHYDDKDFPRRVRAIRQF